MVEAEIAQFLRLRDARTEVTLSRESLGIDRAALFQALASGTSEHLPANDQDCFLCVGSLTLFRCELCGFVFSSPNIMLVRAYIFSAPVQFFVSFF